MDELLLQAVLAYFSEQMQEEIFRSFGLFGLYGYRDAFDAFDDIVNANSEFSSDTTADGILSKLNQGLDYLLEHHTLVLDSTARIEDKNEILAGLYSLQYLENYEPIARILESTRNDVEMVAAILEELTTYDQMFLMELIHSCRPSMLHYLRQFINEKEILIAQAPEQNEKIKDAVSTLAGITTLGDFEHSVLESDLLLGVPFKLFVPILGEDLIEIDKWADSARRVLFTIFLSSDGVDNPLAVYKEHIPALCPNASAAALLEESFNFLLGKYNETKNANTQL